MTRTEPQADDAPPTVPIRTIPATTVPIPHQAAQYQRPRTIRTAIDLTVLTIRAARNNPPFHRHDRATTLAATIRNRHSGHQYQAWEHKCVRCGHTKTTYTALPNRTPDA